MEILIFVVAIALAAFLVTRELWWRRQAAALREQLHAASALGLEREQLANVGQLVSGLAQELKSPLQGVLGNTELLIALARPGTGSGRRSSRDPAKRHARRRHRPESARLHRTVGPQLPLAECLMKAHGGTLEVEQSTGRGFRFQLELPVTAGGAEALAAS
jgi:signal transduction histidine kinase